ncbi:carboxylesterase/lipase family protein [Actinophytocola gossypii]|uniref:Carboxylic ester hydrolase n=1 Tax=Actinophytocola gossypii TaxID=2812003 RepID=A0ABT2J880_9PSEU|nr:carboxylesterase family protein [Actinophytocola gossypii]MCT2584062.1 carboxylesterase family protein [Actinophytocola gossypii]
MKKIGLGLALAALVAGGVYGTAAAFGEAPPAGDQVNAGNVLVDTTSGTVRGSRADGVRTFQGIPYAAAPVGERRWAPPASPADWTGVRDATRQGNACPQPTDLPIAAEPQGEDCLNLNVTAPTRGRDLPVLVWVHGGSLVYGAGDSYGAADMASRGDVVVVTVNYRLGTLGFLAHPALPDSANLGLADQQAALRWVRDNIAAFGGDPDDVTLAGQSGGGYSVCAQLTSPAAEGLFDRAIMQSAPCTGGTTHTRAAAERQGLAVAEEVGCDDVATAARCLRETSTDALVAAGGNAHDDFHPVAGTPLLPRDPAAAVRTGRFHRVPVLVGANHDEDGGRLGGLELVPGAEPLTAEDYVREVRAIAGRHAHEVFEAYPLSAYGSPSEALTAVLTDRNWARSTYDTLRAFSRRVPTFGYEFAERDTGWFPGLPRPSFPVGASHMAELPYLFEVDYIEPATRTYLRATMIDYWTGFVADGDPNGRDDLPGWPSFRRGEYVQSLAAERIGRTDYPEDHNYVLWRRLSR